MKVILVLFCKVKATKAKAKPQNKNPKKVQKRLAAIESELDSVESDATNATNASDFNDSDSSLNFLESNKKKVDLAVLKIKV